MKLIDKIKVFLKGWEKQGSHPPLNNFWKYFIFFPLNWCWTLGSVLFIGLFIKGAIEYQSPLLWVATLFPLIMLVYNFIDEYYAFQWYKTGTRKISAKLLITIVKYLTTIVLLYMIIRTFITG